MEQNSDITSWAWQTCTEFGYFQVAAPQNKLTIVSRKLQKTMSERMCELWFGWKGMSVPKQPDVKKANNPLIYMHRTLNAVKREEKSWGPDQTNNHHPALINILAETMEVDGTKKKNPSTSQRLPVIFSSDSSPDL